MGRIGTAFRLFFRALRNRNFAEQGRKLLDATTPVATEASTKRVKTVRVSTAVRSEALTLLAVLQREARLVDFLKEDIAPFDDAQVGAAVRDVHREASAVIERLFTLRPIMSEAEGSGVKIPANTDAGRIRLTGNVTGQPPFQGTLRHQGWEAVKQQIPEWNGTPASAGVVAPAEVELK